MPGVENKNRTEEKPEGREALLTKTGLVAVERSGLHAIEASQNKLTRLEGLKGPLELPLQSTIQNAFEQDIAKVMEAVWNFEKVNAAFHEARRGVQAYKNFSAYFFPEGDTEKIQLENHRTLVQNQLDRLVRKWQELAPRDSNIAQALANLEGNKNRLETFTIESPKGLMGGFQSTIGIPFSMLGGGITKSGEWISEQGEKLSRYLETARPEMGKISYVAARIGVEIVNIPVGVGGGLIQMAGGLVNIAAHPLETVKGLGSLVGLNSKVTAGEAWKAMGKGIILYDDFKQGHIGLAIGKFLPNLVLTLETAGAAHAGKIAAIAGYTEARSAGLGLTKALHQAFGAFSRGVAEDLTSTLGTVKNLPSHLRQESKRIPSREKTVAEGKRRKEKTLAEEKTAPMLDKDIQQDIKALQFLRTLYTPGNLDTLKRSFHRAINAIDHGAPGKDELSAILLRLKERDPDGYEILRHGYFERLAKSECLDGIFVGNKITWLDETGKKVDAYIGKDIGEGGMGRVWHTVFSTADGKIHYAVMKKPHKAQREFFDIERRAAREIARWDHKNIIKPLRVEEDFIIYETSENAVNLQTAIERGVSPEIYFQSLRETLDGLLEYQRRGMFHGDIKPANILRMESGTGTKIIDNNPVLYERVIDTPLALTPSYSFTPKKINAIYKNFRDAGLNHKEASVIVARAIDAKAYGVMLRDALDHFMPEWQNNSQLSNLVSSLIDPFRGGQPGMLEKARDIVDSVILGKRTTHDKIPTFTQPIQPVPRNIERTVIGRNV